jgi:hypothetical protein
MRCTVDGLTPNRSAMTRMPGLPGVARASRICFSSAGASGRPPEAFALALGLRKAGADSFLNHGALELSKYAQHLKHRLAGGRRGERRQTNSFSEAHNGFPRVHYGIA